MALAVSRLMNAILPPSRPLELEPIEVSAPDDDAARQTEDGTSAGAAGQAGHRMTAADQFLAAATKEHQEGHVDTVL